MSCYIGGIIHIFRLCTLLSVQTIRMVIEVDHFEYGAPHARISVVLVIFQWDQVYRIDYVQRSVYIPKWYHVVM